MGNTSSSITIDQLKNEIFTTVVLCVSSKIDKSYFEQEFGVPEGVSVEKIEKYVEERLLNNPDNIAKFMKKYTSILDGAEVPQYLTPQPQPGAPSTPTPQPQPQPVAPSTASVHEDSSRVSSKDEDTITTSKTPIRFNPKAQRKSRTAYQIKKKMQELDRQLESGGDDDRTVEGDFDQETYNEK
jgi:hypothetical protein